MHHVSTRAEIKFVLLDLHAALLTRRSGCARHRRVLRPTPVAKHLFLAVLIGDHRNMSAAHVHAPSDVQPLDSVPTAVRDAVEPILVGLGTSERDIFLTRLERWLPDVLDGLATLYGPAATATAATLMADAARAYTERLPELRRLDLARTLDPT